MSPWHQPHMPGLCWISATTALVEISGLMGGSAVHQNGHLSCPLANRKVFVSYLMNVYEGLTPLKVDLSLFFNCHNDVACCKQN